MCVCVCVCVLECMFYEFITKVVWENDLIVIWNPGKYIMYDQA